MIFEWFRDRRRDIKFSNCFILEAEKRFNQGELSYNALEKCRKAANNPKVMRAARAQLSSGDGMLGGIRDWNWAAIRQWFIDYFIPAMKIIIPIIMLLEPNPTPEDD